MPGLFVRARIDGPTWRDVLVIPRGVIQQGHVFVHDGGLARRRAVKIDRHVFDQTLVNGLKVGEIVITSNLDALYDGAPVRIQHDPTLAGDTREGEAPAEPASPGEQAADGS